MLFLVFPAPFMWVLYFYFIFLFFFLSQNRNECDSNVCVSILLFSGKSGKNVSRERNCATLRFPSERIFYNWQSFQFDCCVVQCIECFARVLTIITLFFKTSTCRHAAAMPSTSSSFHCDFSNEIFTNCRCTYFPNRYRFHCFNLKEMFTNFFPFFNFLDNSRLLMGRHHF